MRLKYESVPEPLHIVSIQKGLRAGVRAKDLGEQIWGLGFGIWGWGFKVWGLCFRFEDEGLRVEV